MRQIDRVGDGECVGVGVELVGVCEFVYSQRLCWHHRHRRRSFVLFCCCAVVASFVRETGRRRTSKISFSGTLP